MLGLWIACTSTSTTFTIACTSNTFARANTITSISTVLHLLVILLVLLILLLVSSTTFSNDSASASSSITVAATDSQYGRYHAATRRNSPICHTTGGREHKTCPREKKKKNLVIRSFSHDFGKPPIMKNVSIWPLPKEAFEPPPPQFCHMGILILPKTTQLFSLSESQ